MHAARGHEEGLARLESDGVEQQGRGHPRVAREGPGHDHGVGVRAPRGGGPPLQAHGDLLDKLIDLRGRGTGPGGHELGEDLADAEPGRVQTQGAPHAMGERGVEARQDLGGPTRGAEPRHGLVAAQGQHHLRFVIVVLVRAGGIIEGQPRLVLESESLDRLLQRGVDLQRERPLGSDELEQEGQVGTEAPHDVLAQQPLRVGVDEVGQGSGSSCDTGWTGGVGPVPLLGPGTPIGALAEQLGDGRRRAPVIGLARTDESLHNNTLTHYPRGAAARRPRRSRCDAGSTHGPH